MASLARRLVLGSLVRRALTRGRPTNNLVRRGSVIVGTSAVPLPVSAPRLQMSGGPRNPEHKPKNRSSEEKTARRRARDKPRKVKAKALTLRLSKKLSEPVSPKLQPFLLAVESFVVNQWLPSYPDGARLRKLQRDVAWRMNREESPGKLEYDQLVPIVGALVRKGAVRTRPGGKGSSMIITSPTSDDAEEEESSDNA